MANLDDIGKKLDIIIAIMLPPISSSKLADGSQMEVYKLCNIEYTQNEMAIKLKKTKKAIERAIDKLTQKNLIKSIKIDKRVVYIRCK